MKEKYILLKKKAILLSLVSSLILSGCANDNEDNYDEHRHYIFNYGNKSFIIRECEMEDLLVQITTGGLIVNKKDIQSSDYTAIKIKTKEDEEYYRSIEESQVLDGNLITYTR